MAAGVLGATLEQSQIPKTIKIKKNKHAAHSLRSAKH